jgi:hypothetical protein
MIQRLKVAEKEKEGLESKKNEAEDFVDKQAQRLRHKMSAAQIGVLQIRVGGGWGKLGLGGVPNRVNDGWHFMGLLHTVSQGGRPL